MKILSKMCPGFKTEVKCLKKKICRGHCHHFEISQKI